MFHHDLVPEAFALQKLLTAADVLALQLHQMGPIEAGLPENVLQQQGVVGGGDAAGLHLLQHPLFQGDKLVHQL